MTDAASHPERKTVIDIHVHVAMRNQPGCVLGGWLYWKLLGMALIGAVKVNLWDLAKSFDDTICSHLLAVKNGSRRVDKVVLLAMDGIYQGGKLDEHATTYMVSNRFVRQFCARHWDQGFLFGASVNPARGCDEAIRELRRCMGLEPWPGQREIEPGPPPVLVKWVPNSQRFGPSGEYGEFYKFLAEKRVPVLSHAGMEHTMDTRKCDQMLGAPALLKPVLRAGVTVIAAHCASMMRPRERQYHFVKELAQMMDADEHGSPRLFADVSALSTPRRCPEAIKDIQAVLVRHHPDRLVLGSDYPVPPRRPPETENPLDRNLEWLTSEHFPEGITTRAAGILCAEGLNWRPSSAQMRT